MSSTKNFTCSADGLVTNGGSGDLGAGAGAHLPVGLYSGYVFRSLLKFNLDWSGVTSLTSATLYLRTSTQSHLAFGGSPKINVRRMTAGFSEGSYSCESGYSSSTLPRWSQQGGCVSAGQSVASITGSENTWVAIDITAIAQLWFGGTANYGLTLLSDNEGSTSNTTEFQSRSTSYAPYIHIVYETNTAPDSSTATAPSGALASTATTPTFTASGHDPDSGDTCSGYDLQVDTSSAFTGTRMWTVTASTTGLTGWALSRVYAGTALIAGTTYYWRVRFKDAASVYSPWSATKQFVLNRLPAVADADLPYGAVAHVADIWNLNDLVTALTPKPQFTFTPRDPDGDAITAYDIDIQQAGVSVSGSPLTVTGSWASGAAITHKWANGLTNGTQYTVRFRVKDTFGEYSAWSTAVPFRVWYSQAIYEWNVTTAASAFSVTTTGLVGHTQLLYRSATGAGGAGAGSWKTSLPTSCAYVNIMARTCSYGTAPSQPKVGTLKLSWNTTATLPSSWGYSVPGGTQNVTQDPSNRRYGVHALQMDLDAMGATAGNCYAFQDVVVSPDQDYVLSAWWKAEGVSNCSLSIRIYVGGATSVLLKTTTLSIAAVAALNGAGWQRMVLPISSDDLKGNTSVRVLLHAIRTTPTTGAVWWDGVMLNEGTVAPPWTPALIGLPVVLDEQGVVIDGTAGGLLNLFGSAGGARDLVQLGANGLLFGGDTQVYSSQAGRLFAALPGGGTIGIEAVAAAGSRAFVGAQIAGEAVVRSVLWGDASLQGLELGDGTNPRDTNLYRAAANLLKTDDVFQAASFTGKNPIPRVYSANTNWTVPAGGDLSFIEVIVVGGGGGGGGTPATSTGQAAAGGGGGGAGCARKLISASALSAPGTTYAVTSWR